MATRWTKKRLAELALDVRGELELSDEEPFDSYALAEEYGVLVVELDELDCSPEAKVHFTRQAPEVLSGALLPTPDGLVIVENAAHAPVRRRSTMGHEMAHVLLEHSFSPTLVNERGCRKHDPEQEQQANELAGELLVPSSVALRLAWQRATDEQVARMFDVSVKMAAWRMNGTGARLIVQRAAAARRRHRVS